MVILQRPINHYDAYGHRNEGIQLISSAGISGNTLQGSAANSLNGLLFQLSNLSLIATEMFDSILQTSRGTFERISKLTDRVQQMNSTLTNVEQYMIANNHKLLFTNNGYVLTESQRAVLNKVNQENVSKENNPPALAWQYQSNCGELPQFAPELSQLMMEDPQKGLPCIDYYSCPSFFFRHWAKGELQRQKNERKLLKRKKRQEKSGRPANQPAKQVASIQLYRKNFDSQGNKIEHAPSNSISSNNSSSNALVSPSPSTPTPPSHSNNGGGGSTVSPSGYDAYSTNTPSTPLTHSNSSASIKTSPPGPAPPSLYQPPVMNTPEPARNNPIPQPYQSMPSMTAPPVMSNNTGAPPPPGPPPPPPPMSSSMGMPPPPPGPPPPAAVMSSGGGGGGLDAMLQGVSLKKTVEQAPVKKEMNLLEQIRAGKKLAAASERTIAEKPTSTVPTAVSVADILSKKFENVHDDDSESDSDFDDDDWD